MSKIQALAKYLEDDENTITEGSDGIFQYRRHEYLVLTEEEADERVAVYIKDSLWAFNADFLWLYIKACDSLSHEEREAFVRMIQVAQIQESEGFNGLIAALVGDRIDDLIEDAVSADGRGHFLNTYDGQEHEEDAYFIYCIH